MSPINKTISINKTITLFDGWLNIAASVGSIRRSLVKESLKEAINGFFKDC